MKSIYKCESNYPNHVNEVCCNCFLRTLNNNKIAKRRLFYTGMCTPKTTRNLHESLFQNYNLCMKSKLHRKRSTLTGLFLGGFDFKYNKVNYI